MSTALALRGIRKTFGALVAVDGVDLALEAGAIHALVGENGAGKSTLASIAYGTLRADAGSIECSATIGLVHQHFALIDRLSVWENIVLGREPRRGLRLDRDAARRRVRELADRHGLAVDPDAIVENLPVAIRQRVELLRELARAPAVLLLDEPTAALAPVEIERFFATITRLAAGGTAILIVTHKLAEVIAYSRRVTVMRAGRIVARLQTSETDAGAIARLMVGGELPELTARQPTTPQPMLRLESLRAGAGGGHLDACSFAVDAGEIVGIAGVEGNGQAVLAAALAGVMPYEGAIVIDGRRYSSPQTPAQLTAAGIAMIPQDRGREALIADWSIAENAILGRQRSRTFARAGTIDIAAAKRYAGEMIERYDVRPADPNARCGALSGGNQQKIVVGRALAGKPRIVVAYGPTRGIDIAAATRVQSALLDARNAGAAVLLISFELDEILAIADRVIVLHAGRIAGSVARGDLDRASIGALMTGAA